MRELGVRRPRGWVASLLAISGVGAAVLVVSLGKDQLPARPPAAGPSAQAATNSPNAPEIRTQPATADPSNILSIPESAKAAPAFATAAELLTLPQQVLTQTPVTKVCASSFSQQSIKLESVPAGAPLPGLTDAAARAAITLVEQRLEPTTVTKAATVRAYPALLSALSLDRGPLNRALSWVVEVANVQILEPGGKYRPQGQRIQSVAHDVVYVIDPATRSFTHAALCRSTSFTYQLLSPATGR